MSIASYAYEMPGLEQNRLEKASASPSACWIVTIEQR
jgi:hypothetical protein